MSHTINFHFPNQKVSTVHEHVYLPLFSIIVARSSENLYTLRIDTEPENHHFEKEIYLPNLQILWVPYLFPGVFTYPKKLDFFRHPNVACFWERSSGKQASKTYFRHCEGALGPTLRVGGFGLFVEFHRFVCLSFSSVDFVSLPLDK